MYLLNNTKSVLGYRTKKTFMKVYPGQSFFIEDYNIVRNPGALTVITEDEFKKLNNKKETVKKEEKKEVVEVKQEASDEKTDIKDEVKEDVKDNNTEHQPSLGETDEPVKEAEVKEVIEENKKVDDEKKDEKPTKEKRQYKKKLTQEEITSKLEELKIQWESTDNAKEKETIAKEIKELNKKLKG